MRDFDPSGDGFTGQQQDYQCLICRGWMVSKEYILCGLRLWVTRHEECTVSPKGRLRPRKRAER